MEDVLFLDDDDELRGTMGDFLRMYRKGCVLAASVADVKTMGERALSCGVAILDINLGPNQPSGIDAYRWLRGQGFTGKVVFLTGHARSHPLVDQAHRLGDAVVFEKPISIQRLKAILDLK